MPTHTADHHPSLGPRRPRLRPPASLLVALLLALAACAPSSAPGALTPSTSTSAPRTTAAPPSADTSPQGDATADAPDDAAQGGAGVPSPADGARRTSGLTPPPVPDAAYDPDAAGTFPVVEHFFATWAYAYETWDVEPFLDATTPGCEACDGVLREIRGYAIDGTPSTGGAFTITEPRQSVRSPGDIPGWRVMLDQDLLTLTYPGEDYTFSVPGTLGRSFVGLEWDGTRWRVALMEADTSADATAAPRGD